MWFFTLLSWVAALIQFLFASLAIASGLYYLAELVEEYASVACRIIRYLIWVELGVYVCFLMFEEFPVPMTLFGLASQFSYLVLHKNFPYFSPYSFSLICSVGLSLLNHILAFNFFSTHYYPLLQVMGYFTVCLWLIPFSFFISLSINDNVLPTTTSKTDVVTTVFERKRKYGLLSFFQSTGHLLLPTLNKKPY